MTTAAQVIAEMEPRLVSYRERVAAVGAVFDMDMVRLELVAHRPPQTNETLLAYHEAAMAMMLAFTTPGITYQTGRWP